MAETRFSKAHIWSFIEKNFKTNNYRSNFKIGGEIGRKRTTHICLILALNIFKPLENGTIVFLNSNNITNLYVNNQEYAAFRLKGIGKLPNNFGVTTRFNNIFFGNNLPKRAAFTFNAYHKF